MCSVTLFQDESLSQTAKRYQQSITDLQRKLTTEYAALDLGPLWGGGGCDLAASAADVRDSDGVSTSSTLDDLRWAIGTVVSRSFGFQVGALRMWVAWNCCGD